MLFDLRIQKGCRFLVLLLTILITGCTQRQNVVEQDLLQGWILNGDTLNIKELPVTVPSVVQQNLYDAGLIPHPYLGTAEDQLLWISDHPWSYATHFDVRSDLLDKEVVELVFEGIDTYAEVTLNGHKILDTDNQFRTWITEVKSLLKAKDNVLVVDFPRYDSIQLTLYEAHQPRLPEKYAVSRKAPYQHGWDWATKYKNVGIWKPVKLQAWSQARIENVASDAKELLDKQFDFAYEYFGGNIPALCTVGSQSERKANDRKKPYRETSESVSCFRSRGR